MRQMNNNRGVALISALILISLILYFVMQVTYESQVEFRANAQAINQLKSRYAAKAGVELSLLRISLYQKVSAQYAETLGSNAAMLDMIWNFPFVWPPVLPDEVHSIDKDAIDAIVSESFMKANFRADITDEGSRIDINDLGSPSKGLREKTKTQIESIFKSRLDQDDDWARDNRGMNYDEIINNIVDWVDVDTAALNGGDESNYYDHLKTLDKDTKSNWPPNRTFRTLQELRMVAGMTDEIFALLEPKITIFGQKGINPNYAAKDILMTLAPGITSEIADEIIKRRDSQKEGGPFKDEETFLAFLTSKGVRLDDNSTNVPLFFKSPMNFKIVSSGQFGNSMTEITAVTLDMVNTQKRLNEFLDKEKDKSDDEKKGSEPGAAPDSEGGKKDDTKKSENNKKSTPKGPPNIVYWFEKS